MAVFDFYTERWPNFVCIPVHYKYVMITMVKGSHSQGNYCEVFRLERPHDRSLERRFPKEFYIASYYIELLAFSDRRTCLLNS